MDQQQLPLKDFYTVLIKAYPEQSEDIINWLPNQVAKMVQRRGMENVIVDSAGSLLLAGAVEELKKLASERYIS